MKRDNDPFVRNEWLNETLSKMHSYDASSPQENEKSAAPSKPAPVSPAKSEPQQVTALYSTSAPAAEAENAATDAAPKNFLASKKEEKEKPDSSPLPSSPKKAESTQTATSLKIGAKRPLLFWIILGIAIAVCALLLWFLGTKLFTNANGEAASANSMLSSSAAQSKPTIVPPGAPSVPNFAPDGSELSLAVVKSLSESQSGNPTMDAGDAMPTELPIYTSSAGIEQMNAARDAVATALGVSADTLTVSVQSGQIVVSNAQSTTLAPLLESGKDALTIAKSYYAQLAALMPSITTPAIIANISYDAFGDVVPIAARVYQNISDDTLKNQLSAYTFDSMTLAFETDGSLRSVSIPAPVTVGKSYALCTAKEALDLLNAGKGWLAGDTLAGGYDYTKVTVTNVELCNMQSARMNEVVPVYRFTVRDTAFDFASHFSAISVTEEASSTVPGAGFTAMRWIYVPAIQE